MPIKFPIGFPRRKSAGNALEILESQAAPSSFRVLKRDEVAEYGSPREGRMQKKGKRRPNSSPLRQYSDPSIDEDGQYLSYRTHNSNSTAAGSSSARHSYQSTDPSSIESTSHDDLKSTDQNPPFPRRAAFEPEFFEQFRGDEEPGFSASISKKKFSITRPRFGISNNPAPRRSSEATETRRGRSQTITSHASSYASTSVPPKVELGLGLGSVGNTDLSSPWFDGLGSNGRTTIMQNPPSVDLPEPPRPIFRSESDSLLTAKKQFSFDESDDRPLPLSPRLHIFPRPDQHAPRLVEQTEPQTFLSSSEYRRSPENRDLGLHEASPPLDDVDNQLLLDAAYASQALERRLGMPSQKTTPVDRSRDFNDSPRSPTSAGSRELRTTLPKRDNMVHVSPKATPPRIQNDESTSLFESSPASTVVHNISEAPPTLQRTSRVMTPAEFERAKQSAAATQDDDDESEQSDEGDLYEDEDETERTRQLAKQRRKQEAHLAIYRQQMMKVTGEQPTDLPERPKMSRLSQSVPNLAPMFASTNGKMAMEAEQGGKSDDSDDEIPLGVLQAHGFPTKNRPPTRMAEHMLRPSSSYPAPAGSTRNDPSAGGGGSGTLPPFARNLPADPYIGAGLVNQANRESMPYNSPSAPTTPSSSLPPGGLVGVIVGEERARAMRRGSPNTNGVYAPLPPQQPMAHPGSPQLPMMNPMNSMPGQHQLSPAEQAQMDMNNSVTQMMQMQMQWMQQFMQMQAMSQQSGTPMPQMPFMGNQMQQALPGAQQTEFLSPQQQQESTSNLGSFHQRSASSLSSYLPGASPAPSSFGVTPMTSMEGVQSRYAPSIAPSERSNVGQPSRYRPVTPNGASTRTSTLSYGTAPTATPSTYGMLNNPRARSPVRNQVFPSQLAELRNPYASNDAFNMPPTIRAVSRPKKGTGGATTDGSDDEDAAGWEEMKRKREERKSRWRPRRNTVSQSQGGASAGLEALYYNGPSE